mmetsp:Transcript_35849/g.83421  ORF Transcript_35849/g.83421 Transcript_35849/m.83421 type:complete len:161 (+) Transcript_35849:177-659(+)
MQMAVCLPPSKSHRPLLVHVKLKVLLAPGVSAGHFTSTGKSSPRGFSVVFIAKTIGMRRCSTVQVASYSTSHRAARGLRFAAADASFVRPAQRPVDRRAVESHFFVWVSCGKTTRDVVLLTKCSVPQDRKLDLDGWEPDGGINVVAECPAARPFTFKGCL